MFVRMRMLLWGRGHVKVRLLAAGPQGRDQNGDTRPGPSIPRVDGAE